MNNFDKKEGAITIYLNGRDNIFGLLRIVLRLLIKGKCPMEFPKWHLVDDENAPTDGSLYTCEEK